MTVEGLIYFSKNCKIDQKTDILSDSITWGKSFLRVRRREASQDNIRFEYHLFVKSGADLRKLLHPSSIDSKDWEGFFLSDTTRKFPDPLDGIAVTYSLDETVCRITRDTFGLVPLYYYHLPDQFLAFSTSLPSLLEIDGVISNLTANTSRIIQYLSFRADSITDYTEETFFDQIKSVLPGHQITVSAEKVITTPYVNFEPEKWDGLNTLPEFATAFNKVFGRSVKKAAAYGEVIGAHLSGGMDSSSISAVSKKQRPDVKLHTFHSAPNMKFASENHHAQAVADMIGSVHHEVPPRHNDFEFLTKYTSAYGHPECMVISPSMQGSLIEAAILQDCTTLLMGHDGDSVVGSGFDYLANLFDQRKWSELKEFLAPRIHNPSFLRLFKNWNELDDSKKLQAVYHDFFGRRFQEVTGKLTISQLFKLFTEIKANFDISSFHFVKRGFNSVLRKLLDKPIPNSILRDSTRISHNRKPKNADKRLSRILSQNLGEKYVYSLSSVYNAQSITMNEEFFALGNYYNIQTALPFFDKELFELCMAVPSKIKLGDGIGREHFREAMLGILPETVRRRRDKAVFGAYARQASIRLFKDAKHLLDNQENEVWKFVDKAKFQKITEILLDEKQNSFAHGICHFHMLRTVSLAVWFDWLNALQSNHLNKKKL